MLYLSLPEIPDTDRKWIDKSVQTSSIVTQSEKNYGSMRGQGELMQGKAEYVIY